MRSQLAKRIRRTTKERCKVMGIEKIREYKIEKRLSKVDSLANIVRQQSSLIMNSPKTIRGVYRKMKKEFKKYGVVFLHNYR